MSSFKIVSYPNPLTRKQLVELRREITFFLMFRIWLIGHFGIRLKTLAEAAIQVYRKTWEPQAVQIHVRQASTRKSDIRIPSFRISAETNNTLYNAGFLRFRYASVEEQSGQYQTSPFKILCTWCTEGVVTAVLIDTTTRIKNQVDSTSIFLLRRQQNGDWKISRSWQLGCAPKSNAWKLGTVFLKPKDLVQAKKLEDEQSDLNRLLETHKHLLNGQHRYPIEQGTSYVHGRKDLYQIISDTGRLYNPELCALYIDHQLFQPTSSPSKVG